MKYPRLRRLAALAIVATFLLVKFAPTVQGTEAELKAINERAAEIAPMLDDDFGARTAPREYWERFAKAPDAAQIVKYAESVLNTEPPEVPEELYKEYYKNGNRSNYQNVFFNIQRRISSLTLAEATENKGRFIDALNVELDKFCTL